MSELDDPRAQTAKMVPFWAWLKWRPPGSSACAMP